LQKCNQNYAELVLDPLLNFDRLSKATINRYLLLVCDRNKSFELKLDNETDDLEVHLQLFMKKKLTRALDKEMNFKITSKSRTTKYVTSIVKTQLVIFEVQDKRKANLEFCYENFNSIPPRSVEPERVFSGCGRTV
jgi:hypothetical protein